MDLYFTTKNMKSKVITLSESVTPTNKIPRISLKR